MSFRRRRCDQWTTLVRLNFGDVPQFVFSYASGAQVSRVTRTSQKNCLIPGLFFSQINVANRRESAPSVYRTNRSRYRTSTNPRE